MVQISAATELLCEQLALFVVKALRRELIDTDLKYTATLLNSIESKMSKEDAFETINFFFEDYGLVIDEGYGKEDASDRLSRIGEQAYLEELQEWFISKLDVEPKRAAKAASTTLEKHLEKGFKSKRSKGGRGFIAAVSSRTREMSEILLNMDIWLEAFYDELRLDPSLKGIQIYKI